MTQALFLLLLVIFSFSCQTLPKEDIKLPPEVEKLYSHCFPSDGSSQLIVRDFSSILDWSSENGRSFIADLSNPVGQSLLSLTLQEESGHFNVSSSGMLTQKLTEIGVIFSFTEDGFLKVNNHLIPIKYNEIACFLKFCLPYTWRAEIISFGDFNGIESSFSIISESEKRRMKTNVTFFSQNKNDIETCTQLEWKGFLDRWTNPTLTWCQQVGQSRKGRLTGIKDYSLEWVDISDK